ncbi:MAG TPA: 4Fe-4S dicluster domain-containing protein [Pyrinomonadaceae bacterium]|nr:4Fe-4S dicluster domain-containing protein [Pyrinomonadaceae bacterium]
MKTSCEKTEPTKKQRASLPVLPSEKSRPHSTRGRWRAGVLITITVLMIVHLIQWLVMGVTVSPIEPSEAMHTIQRGTVNAGAIFFALAILSTLILGRWVCGWGCHIVALQDFCLWLLNKLGLKPREFRSRLLIFVPVVVAFYMFAWPTVVRFFTKPKNESLIPQFTNHLITTGFWDTFPPVFVAIPFLFICGFLTVYFLGNKGFCTYACPYGGIFGIAEKVALGRIRVTDDCNSCGHCTAVCTSNVIVHTEVEKYKMVVDPGCMKCMDCVSACPNDALYFGFGKPSLFVETTPSKSYNLTWFEEIGAAIVFGLSYFFVWDVYQLVPMLMALGIACVTTFLVVRLYQMVRSTSISFYSWNLRNSKGVTTKGWIFVALASIWIGLNIHSGWIVYNEIGGRRAYETITLPDELAIAQADPGTWLSDVEKDYVRRGREYYYRSRSTALFTNKEAVSRLAWLEFFDGDATAAATHLAESAELMNGPTRALNLYYRGAVLNTLGRYDEAIQSFQKALAQSPELIVAEQEKAVSLWQLGRREEAMNVWKRISDANPNLPLAATFLAVASNAAGDTTSGAMFQKRADAVVPQDARYLWMVGLRLRNLGFKEQADRYFMRAIQMEPSLRQRLAALE